MSQFQLRIILIHLMLIIFVCQIRCITSKNIESPYNRIKRDAPLINKKQLSTTNATTEDLHKDSSNALDVKSIKEVTEKPANVTSPKNVPNLTSLNTLKHMSMNSGAMLRGFYLLLGLSVLLVLYFAFRAFRLRKSRAERKYGILRQDSDNQELTPLPLGLAEDESDGEDQTVFEVRRTTDHV